VPQEFARKRAPRATQMEWNSSMPMNLKIIHQIRQHVMNPRGQCRLMRRQVGLLSIVGFFGLLGTADAQTLSALTAGPAFDGTYRAVSSAKVNQSYYEHHGNMLFCPDRMPGPLTIVQGQARYTTASGVPVDGTVGSQGELTMRAVEGGDSFQPMELDVRGSVAGNGTVSARQIGYSCSYDFVWQRNGQQTPSTAGRSLSIVSSPTSRRAR
jgi:hypothetical protein